MRPSIKIANTDSLDSLKVFRKEIRNHIDNSSIELKRLSWVNKNSYILKHTSFEGLHGDRWRFQYATNFGVGHNTKFVVSITVQLGDLTTECGITRKVSEHLCLGETFELVENLFVWNKIKQNEN